MVIGYLVIWIMFFGYLDNGYLDNYWLFGYLNWNQNMF